VSVDTAVSYRELMEHCERMHRLFEEAFVRPTSCLTTEYDEETKRNVHEAFKRLVSELPKMADQLRAFGVDDGDIIDIKGEMITASDFIGAYAKDENNIDEDGMWGDPLAYSSVVRAAIYKAELSLARKLLLGEQQ
jgi:hypothetical protein